MKLIGVAMVKNEADIVEAFVRHNLKFLDHLVVIDHASSDATLAILGALRDEGLPLEILRDPSMAFRQADRLTVVVRDALQRHQAEFAFALDADEFIRASSREALRLALESQSAPVLTLPWTIYVAPATGSTEPHPLKRLRLRVVTAQPSLSKVIVRREFVERGEWMIATGNHWVIVPRDDGYETLAAAPLREATLAHLPFRSPDQFLAKVILGWFGNRLLQGTDARASPVNWHWRELFDAYLRGDTPDWADIQRYALQWYALQPTPDAPRVDFADVQLIEDPLPADFELRYTPLKAADPLRLLAAWTEGFLDTVRTAD